MVWCPIKIGQSSDITRSVHNMKQMDNPQSVQEAELKSLLETKIAQAIEKYPRWLDRRLCKGLDRMVVNASSNFMPSRSLTHLQKLLLAQFFLQKRIELPFSTKVRYSSPCF